MNLRAICTQMLILSLAVPTLLAHGGGLDRNGCHTNRKTGEYHCHRSGAPAAATPLPRATPLLSASSTVTASDAQLALAMQHMLRALGYFTDPADGEITVRMRQAVRRFRADRRLTGGEMIDGQLLVQLAEALAARATD